MQVESQVDNLDDLGTFSSMTIEETKAAADALFEVMEVPDKGPYSQDLGSARTGTITCVREQTCGANWYQPRMARNSGVAIASGLSSS